MSLERLSRCDVLGTGLEPTANGQNVRQTALKEWPKASGSICFREWHGTTCILGFCLAFLQSPAFGKLPNCCRAQVPQHLRSACKQQQKNTFDTHAVEHTILADSPTSLHLGSSALFTSLAGPKAPTHCGPSSVCL